MLVFASAWAHTAFASTDNLGNVTGGHGGAVGELVGNVGLSALDKFPASLLFLVFTVFSAFFAFGISPKVLLKLGNLFKREQPEGEDLEALKARTAQPGFQLNEGVPVVHHGAAPKEQPRLTGLKNTAQKLTANENHEALTTASDPNWQFPGVDLLNQKQDKADAGDVNANAQAIIAASTVSYRWLMASRKVPAKGPAARARRAGPWSAPLTEA